jgi:hypothetical protein
MSVSPEGFIEDEPQDYTGELHTWPAEAPSSGQHRAPPEFGSCMTWVIPQVGQGQPVQILQRQPQRFKAKWIVAGPAGNVGVVLNSKLDPLQGASPQGITITVQGSQPDWESQQPLYAIATTAGVTISIWDETYALR